MALELLSNKWILVCFYCPRLYSIFLPQQLRNDIRYVIQKFVKRSALKKIGKRRFYQKRIHIVYLVHMWHVYELHHTTYLNEMGLSFMYRK